MNQRSSTLEFNEEKLQDKLRISFYEKKLQKFSEFRLVCKYFAENLQSHQIKQNSNSRSLKEEMLRFALRVPKMVLQKMPVGRLMPYRGIVNKGTHTHK